MQKSDKLTAIHPRRSVAGMGIHTKREGKQQSEEWGTGTRQ